VATDGTRARSASYAPQLDGLRAAAVIAVAWSHWLPAWQFGLPLGAGVHLFFVLSGFLITRILLDLRALPQRRPAVGRFYVRRALRLFPAFFLVLGVAAWAAVPLVRETWPWHAAYLSNVFVAREARWQGHVSHFWSLAVEEQFYLVWPWLIVFAPARWLGAVVGGTILLGPLARLTAAAAGLGEPFWALVPGGSADSLGLGAWVALAAAGRPDGRPSLAARPWMALAAAAAWVGLAVAEVEGPLPAVVTVWRQVVQGVVFAWIVSRAATGFAGGVGRALAHPVALGIGRISYGLYLIHPFAAEVAFATTRAFGIEAWVPVSAGARAALYAVTTVALAAPMWRWVERPVLAWKSRVPYA
jgi:peptidoglycan/LPS O-acetylase OafA/YrhL